MQFAVSLRNSRLSAIVAAIGTGATLKVYTGTSPGVAVGPSGTLLATLTALTFGTPANGSVTLSATADSSASASGTPGYVRVSGGTGGGVIDLTAGVGAGEANFNNAVSLGGTVTLNSGTITEGNA